MDEMKHASGFCKIWRQTKNIFVQIFKIWPAGRPLGEPAGRPLEGLFTLILQGSLISVAVGNFIFGDFSAEHLVCPYLVTDHQGYEDNNHREHDFQGQGTG